MALSSYKFTQGELAGSDIASLPDQPSAAGITAAQLKARFDLIPKMLIALGKFNQLIDALVAGGGADLGASVPGMDGSTVQALLIELKGLSDQLHAALASHKADAANPHQVTKSQVGLGLADNTSDLDKPISRAQGAVNATVSQALSDRYTKAQTDNLLDFKADKTTTNIHIKEVAFDPDSGIFTFTRENGTSFAIDTLIEKIPLDVQLVDNKLVLTLSDGTTQEADLSAFIDTYTFQDSDTLAFSTAGKVISAIIKDGSVTLEKLNPEAQAVLLGYTNRAEAAAAGAEAAKTEAEAARDTAKSSADTATAKANDAAASAAEALASKNAAAQSAANLAQAVNMATAKAEEAASSAVAAKGSEQKAKASETLVQAAAEAAKASEIASKASESAAAGSANSARDSKTAAKTSETNAAASAQTATTKAGEASSSATAAANSAQGIGEAEERAAASAALSTDQAALAKSYTVGGTGTRPGEDTDNAKYYKDQAAAIAGGDYATKLDVSTAKQEAIDVAAADAAAKAASAESNAKAASIPVSQKGTAGGVATLDASGKVPTSQLPPMDYDPAGSAQAVADSLAAVATTGSYNDLKDKPAPFDPSTLARVATTGAYGDLTGRPGNATSNADGLMPKTDKAKLDGIEAGANNYTHPATHPASMISGLGEAAVKNVGTDSATVAAGDHTHADYLKKSGDTMVGALKVPTPVAAEDAANKGYVDQRVPNIGTATETATGVVRGGGLVSVDANGDMDILAKADGKKWDLYYADSNKQIRAPSGIAPISCLSYCNGRFILTGATSQNNYIRISVDGINWYYKMGIPDFPSLKSIIYANGIYYGVGSSTGDGNIISYSTDLKTWTSEGSGYATSLCDIVYNEKDGYIYAVGGTATSPVILRTKAGYDGFTKVNISGYGRYESFVSITCSMDKDLIVATSGPTDAQGSRHVWVSKASNVNFEPYPAPETGNGKIVYGNGLFVSASFDQDGIAYSRDGLNWESAVPLNVNQWPNIVFGNGLFIISNTTGDVAISKDAEHWERVTIPEGVKDFVACAYGNGMFMLAERLQDIVFKIIVNGSFETMGYHEVIKNIKALYDLIL